MILFWITLIVAIATWIFFGFSVDDRNTFGLGVLSVVAVLSTTITVFGIVTLATKDSDGYAFQERRDYYSELVKITPEAASFKTIEKTINTAESINRRIERNKRHCYNRFYGYMFNKEIAETEPIDIPDLNVTWSFGDKNERDL